MLKVGESMTAPPICILGFPVFAIVDLDSFLTHLLDDAVESINSDNFCDAFVVPTWIPQAGDPHVRFK